MEVNFALELDNQTQVYEGRISMRHLKIIFIFDNQGFMSGTMEMFNLEYLETYWMKRTNMDITSPFVALALLVGETKEEVHRVIVAYLDP